MGQNKSGQNFDEIDRILLRILSKNPRKSYNSIASMLSEEDHEMSAEGVRHRIGKLLDATSTFFMFAPGEHDWEILRVGVTVADDPGAKPTVREYMSDVGYWFISDGLGTIDIYASGTVTSVGDAEQLIRETREHELVTDVDFSFETKRTVDIENYFPRPESQTEDA